MAVQDNLQTPAAPIAKRVAACLKEITGTDVPTGALDITLYRDDIMRGDGGGQPVVRSAESPFDLDG